MAPVFSVKEETKFQKGAKKADDTGYQRRKSNCETGVMGNRNKFKRNDIVGYL